MPGTHDSDCSACRMIFEESAEFNQKTDPSRVSTCECGWRIVCSCEPRLFNGKSKGLYPRFDVQLGCTVDSASHMEQIAKSRGLVPMGREEWNRSRHAPRTPDPMDSDEPDPKLIEIAKKAWDDVKYDRVAERGGGRASHGRRQGIRLPRREESPESGKCIIEKGVSTMPDETVATDSAVATTTPEQGTEAPANDLAQTTNAGEGVKAAPQGFDEEWLTKLDPASRPDLRGEVHPKGRVHTEDPGSRRGEEEVRGRTCRDLRACPESHSRPAGRSHGTDSRGRQAKRATRPRRRRATGLPCSRSSRWKRERQIQPIQTQVALQNAAQTARANAIPTSSQTLERDRPDHPERSRSSRSSPRRTTTPPPTA